MEANELNATDLMIGDWVQIVNDAPIMAGEYHYVDWVRTGELGLDNRKTVTYPYITPIHITPEILEKNGFKWNTHHTSMLLVVGSIHLSWGFYKDCISASDWSDDGDVSVTSLRCKFIHQLQHILRDFGIKKEIIV